MRGENISMKCPNCGGDVTGKFCEFCGSQITIDMKKEQEALNKVGCPNCGSTNIKFEREKQGEIKGKNGTAVVRATVGLCKDCGYTWRTTGNIQPTKKNNMLWWILGWIFFFPAPVMVLIWRKKCTWDTKIKIAVTVVFWILVFIIGGVGGGSETSKGKDDSNIGTIAEIKETHIYDDAEIVDLMNGIGTSKIGTITVTYANQSECTEDALIDWFFNYVKANSDSNYHIIVYSDIPQKGVYTIGSGFIQKDITLTAENDGTYRTGDDAGSTYYIVDEAAKKLIAGSTMADSSIVEDIKAKVDAVIPDDYKKGDLYSVDVAGVEGSMECVMILINEEFASADYQSIAVELATKVKELGLGIGYFDISFQKGDYSINALSRIEDLNSQDPSEMDTITFE